MSSHFHSLKIADIRNETADCISIAFDIPPALEEEFRFSQGQNITLRMNVDGEEIRRSYSICSSPIDKELRVAIKKVEAGRFSGHAHSTLQKGQLIDVLAPSGKFYTKLNAQQRKTYLAFAAGSGITPILSIIKTTLTTEPQSNFILVYGNRTRSSIIFREQLEALKNRFMDRFSLHHVLSRESMDSPINAGRIDKEKCETMNNRIFNLQSVDEVFLCGPEQMIFDVKDWLQSNGFPENRIHFELFLSPGQKLTHTPTRPADNFAAVEDKTSSVTVILDGTKFQMPLEYNGLPILDRALAEGADLPYACKGGVCATCKAKLIEGSVEMDTNYALEPDETEAGFILTCQSHPRSPTVVVDFDAKS